MSGIYIPRLRVPEDGFITITVTSDGRVVGNSKKESGKFEYLDNEDIAKAVPVPPHGRLIDESEIPWCVDWYAGRKRYYTTPKTVEHLPTIIPASGGNGNE